MHWHERATQRLWMLGTTVPGNWADREVSRHQTIALATDDSLTKVGQRDLQVASEITAERRAALFLQREGAAGVRGTYFQKDRQEVRTLAEDEKGEWMHNGSGDQNSYICWRFLISCLTLAAPLLRKQESDGHFPRDNTAGTAWLPPGSPAPAAGLPLSLHDVSLLWPACMPVDVWCMMMFMYDEKGWLNVCCGLRCSLFSVTQRFYYFIVYKLLTLAKYLHSHQKEDWWRSDPRQASSVQKRSLLKRAHGHQVTFQKTSGRADGLGYLQILWASLISPHTFSEGYKTDFKVTWD